MVSEVEPAEYPYWMKLEDMGMEVFPAFVEEHRNGCVFRAAGGVNYRNSSVAVLDPSVDLDWLLEETVSFSRAHQIEPVLRVPRLWPSFEEALASRGWQMFRLCTVMDRSLAEEKEPEAGDPLLDVDHERWLGFQLSARPLKPETAHVMTQIFSMLPERAERLVWREGGEELASALLWNKNGYSALMNMLVSPAARGKGVGKRFLAAMFQHAKGQGADTMWLQVLLDNTPAVSLYKAAGFSEVYRYAYYRGTL